jgi:uncharacterized SAM-binding protein YcdF (DUF218 family)
VPTAVDHARVLWDYMSSFRGRGAAEAIVICCSYDLRVADYAAELMARGLAPVLVCSGDTGNWTRHIWDRPEAAIFAERAVAAGVDPAAIIVEDRSTNFGENIAFSRALIPDANRVIFLTKPAAILRVSLTAAIQWPAIERLVDAPDIAFPDEVSNVVGVLGIIDEMVGDLHRCLEYPALGYQAPHNFPVDVLESWKSLIHMGFRHHLIADRPVDRYFANESETLETTDGR